MPVCVDALVLSNSTRKASAKAMTVNGAGSGQPNQMLLLCIFSTRRRKGLRMAYRPSNSRSGKVKPLPSVGEAVRGDGVHELEERADKWLADVAAARGKRRGQ